RSGGFDVEAASAAAVRRARNIVAAHDVWHRDVFIGRCADEARTQIEIPDLGRAEVLHDLRAGLAGGAAIQNPAGRQTTDRVGPRCPPQRAFTARFIHLQRAVRQSKASVQRDAAAGDDRPGAVVDLPAVLVFGEAELNERAQKVARLRNTSGDRPGYLTSERVRRSAIVLLRILEKGPDVAKRRKTDPENVRIFRGEHHLI